MMLLWRRVMLLLRRVMLLVVFSLTIVISHFILVDRKFKYLEANNKSHKMATTTPTVFNIDAFTPFASASSIGGIPISNVPPSADGQVLQFNQSLNMLQFATPTSLSSPWTRIPDATTTQEELVYNSIFPTTPTDNLVAGPQTTEGPGTQLFFINNATGGQGSFRAGSVTGAQWTLANRGVDSFAGGLNNTSAAAEGFVGAGSTNTIAAAAAQSFIGAGQANTANGIASAIVAGGGVSPLGNTTATTGTAAFIGAGQGNAASGPNSVICGGGGASPLGNATGALATSAFVGAGQFNSASGPLSAIVAGGGGTSLVPLTNSTAVGATGAFIGAGTLNSVTGATSAIVAGSNNIASGTSAFIGGGTFNAASGNLSVVCGGGGTNLLLANQAEAATSVISGGSSNVTKGINSMIPGGNNNLTVGNSSLAAGNFANATFNNSFVWGDGTSTLTNPTVDTAANQFIVSCAGGSFFYTTARPGVVGPSLAFNSADWITSSDRAIKENIVDVDADDILQRVIALPIYTYNMIGSDPSARCIGPVAQEWNAQFVSSKNPLGIDNADQRGVALAAIKALAAKSAAIEARHDALAHRIELLELKLAATSDTSE
jgi:hypothetical protein